MGRRLYFCRRIDVAAVKLISRLMPKTMPGQMIAVLTLSLVFLLAVLTALEINDQENVTEWAQNDLTVARLKRMKSILENVQPDKANSFLESASTCHEGYTLAPLPFRLLDANVGTRSISETIRDRLSLGDDQIVVSRTQLSRNDFSYARCDADEIELPIVGIVISLQLSTGQWLNAEVHPHEWHFRDGTILWVLRSIGVFLFVGTLAVVFIRRLTRPLRNLTEAAEKFGPGLNISQVSESGPPDLKRALKSFNDMQRQVSDEIAKRTNTLASISHDVRSPLTALRIKTELIENDQVRQGLLLSIEKMERMITTSLDFLKGESESEKLRNVDLASLIESECDDFADLGYSVQYHGLDHLEHCCRPDALSRALRNLVENGLRYGTNVRVGLEKNDDSIFLTVRDDGPGIAPEDVEQAITPFKRLSSERKGERGGFGLGLAIAKAVAEGHKGELRISDNEPNGLTVTIRLPLSTN